MKALIISDIHANFTALQEVLNNDGNYDLLLFLGDIVDYGPNPRECLDFIKNNADYYVRGNHDNAIGYESDCNSMGTFRSFSIETRAWHRKLMTEDDIDFFRRMPIFNKAHIEGNSFFMAHASPQGDISEYLSVEEMTTKITGIKTENILVGHTHVQYEKQIDQSLIVNPGSVGLPRDGSEACYAVYENNLITLKRIEYDVEKTISDLRKAPLSESCKEGITKILLHKQDFAKTLL